MSISSARGRLRPEMRSPVDGATMIFYSCFVDTYCLSYFNVINFFLIAKNGAKKILVARGVLESAQPAKSGPAREWYGLAWSVYRF
jgi:hypothetical protein